MDVALLLAHQSKPPLLFLGEKWLKSEFLSGCAAEAVS